ncbi:MAG: hypothetical protein O2809_00775 [Proteobacteria bacterium]|nr:hypothetical protein [Pseudomonadota bacterium]
MFLDSFKPFNYSNSLFDSIALLVSQTDLNSVSSDERSAIAEFLKLMSFKDENAARLSDEYLTSQQIILRLENSESQIVDTVKSIIDHPILSFVQIGLSNMVSAQNEDTQTRTLIFKLNEVQSNWLSVDTFMRNVIFVSSKIYGINQYIDNIKRAELDVDKIAQNCVFIQDSVANISRDLLATGRLKSAELLLRSYDKFCKAITVIYSKAELNHDILMTYKMAEANKPKRDQNYKSNKALTSPLNTIFDANYDSLELDTSLHFSFDDMQAKGWLNLNDYDNYSAELSVYTNTGKPRKFEHKDVIAQYQRVHDKIDDMRLFAGEKLNYALAEFDRLLKLTLKTKSYSHAMIGEINGILSSFMQSISNVSKDESVYSIIREACELKRVISKLAHIKTKKAQQAKATKVIQTGSEINNDFFQAENVTGSTLETTQTIKQEEIIHG